MSAPSIRIEALKGLHELMAAAPAPERPKFDPRKPMTALATRLLAAGMVKMQAGAR